MTREEEYLKKLLTHFPTYVNYVYGHIGLPKTTELQWRLSEIMGENPDRIIIEAGRGTGKSWLGGIYTTWRLLRNPDEKI